jgi:FKBP-type peptidyl-prolyl cis-trans isomerase FkpA
MFMLRLAFVENSKYIDMIKKVFKTSVLLMTAGFIFSLTSCDPAKKYEKREKEEINTYLSNNSSQGFEQKESGLYYAEVTPGTGAGLSTHDTAYVEYTGKFLDGNTFDTNVGKEAFAFPVGEGYAIAGFDEGVSYMKAGGKSLFLIPSSLAYGSQGYYTIGGFTPLLFEVVLKKVVPSAKK